MAGPFTPEQRQRAKESICEQIAEGINLREICRQDGMPTWRSVYDWMYTDAEFASAIARAREVGYHAIASETLTIADTEPERIVSEQGARIDPGYVAWQKLRVDQRMKLLAKWSPKLYGDKVSAETEDETPAAPVTVVVQVKDARADNAES